MQVRFRHMMIDDVDTNNLIQRYKQFSEINPVNYLGVHIIKYYKTLT